MNSSAGTAAFKDLVIDATDGIRTAEFWAAVLGLSAEANGAAGDAVLRGTRPEQTLWINQVPEPRTVKQRVHLDVNVADLPELIKLGATTDVEHDGWTIMRDPEGGEFCAFLRDPDQNPGQNPDQAGDYRLYELVVDAADPELIAGWWGRRFDLEPQSDGDNPWFWLEGGSLPWPMVFNPVPESKAVKNRVHWDVWGDTADYLAAGATMVRTRDDEISWDVLADPEGNEFCVFTR
jgi:hypothetical protein